MSYLMGKVKGRVENIIKILVEENIFVEPEDLVHPHEYDSDYKLEDDEWFYIPEFSETNYCMDWVKREFISGDYDQATPEQLTNLVYLCYASGNQYFFQKVNKSQVVQKKWLSLSGDPIIKESPILLINSTPDAIYDKNDDALYFKKLPSLTSIFKGIGELYKEATQAETVEFLGNDFIKLGDDYDADKVKTANRKRIAMAMDTLNSFETEDKHQIFSYIKDYCSELPFDEEEENFTISTEDELKHLLWGIEQRYYTTPVGHTKRVANSVSDI